MTEVYNFGLEPITSFAFNKNKTEVALCKKKPHVEIYKKDESKGKWEQSATLVQHDLVVTGIDWAPNTNRIVTCSEDKNAYVWCYENGVWTQSLVHLRTNRAATCVKWSPKEDKFAVGTGSKRLAVCIFDEQNDWWSSKHIHKPFLSTVTSVCWHPNNVVIACGSTDFSANVIACPIKEVDGKPAQPCEWGEKLIFGSVLASASSPGGWVHDVCFSPNGSKLAWVSHNSQVSVMEPGTPPRIIQVKCQILPFLHCIWLSEDKLVVAGYEDYPVLFTYNSNKKELSIQGKLESPKEKKKSELSARQMFKNLDLRAEGTRQVKESSSVHQRTISQIVGPLGPGGSKFATSGLDGVLAIWDLNTVDIVANLNGNRKD